MNDSMPRVLLLDDDASLLRALSRQLKEYGFDVITSISAAEATAILGSTRIDALVCDNEMPGTTGFQFLAGIRTRFPDVTRFMLSGTILDRNAERAVAELGVTRVFHKPCDSQTLCTAIEASMNLTVNLAPDAMI